MKLVLSHAEIEEMLMQRLTGEANTIGKPKGEVLIRIYEDAGNDNPVPRELESERLVIECELEVQHPEFEGER